MQQIGQQISPQIIIRLMLPLVLLLLLLACALDGRRQQPQHKMKLLHQRIFPEQINFLLLVAWFVFF